MPNSTIEQHLSLLSFWVNVASVIVAVGICGEYLLAISEGKKGGPKWKRYAKLALAVLIVVGLGMESWFGRKQTLLAQDIQNDSDRMVADAIASADAAKERAADANAKAGDAYKQAGLANKAAENERSARIALQSQLSPPYLSATQCDDLCAHVSRFGSQRIDIFLMDEDFASKEFAAQLARTLSRAGWSVELWTVEMSGDFGESLPPVSIASGIPFNGRFDSRVVDARVALTEALNACGLKIGEGPEFPSQAPSFVAPEWPMQLKITPWETAPGMPPSSWVDSKASPIRIMIAAKHIAPTINPSATLQ